MRKILYVDDDDDIREIALMCLTVEPDLDPRGAASGQEALDLVESWEPDLILLDVMMPGMDGPATLKKLIERRGAKLAPVVFCTARAQARDLSHYSALGAAGVIAKPFDPMSLGKQAKAFLR